jgi:two-component sensor histidine kinase/GAF domain-containing protein
MDVVLQGKDPTLNGQMRVLEMAATGAPLAETLAELVHFIEAHEEGLTCGILIVADDGAHFRRGCGPKLPETYHVALDGVPITPPYLGACGEAAHCGTSVSVADIANEERFSEDWRQLVLSCGLASCLSTPVIGSDGRVLASFAMYHDTARDQHPSNPEIVEVATHLAAIALEREMFIKRLKKELAATRQLHDVSSILIQEADADALHTHIIDAAMTLMGSDAASMQMLDLDRGELRLLAWKGFHPESAAFWEWVRIDSESTCGAALKAGERVVVSDVEFCDFMAGAEDLDHYRKSGIRAVQSTPLISRSGHLLGMLSTHWYKPKDIAESELHLLDVLARQAADLLERTQAEAAIQRNEQRLRALLDATSDVVYRMSPNWTEMRYLAGREFIPDMLAPSSNWLDIYIHPDDQPRVTKAINKAIHTKSAFELEHRVRRTDGTLGWTASRAIPLFDDDGEITEWFGMATDITPRKQAEERQKILIHELNHRVKNTLATVQAMASQTFRGSNVGKDVQDAFSHRLVALAGGHDVLTQEHWERADLRDVVEKSLAPFRGLDGSRWTVEGLPFYIKPKAALAFTMALHELATNATKYGALSNEAGRIEVTWGEVAASGILCFRWEEKGGPAVTPPERKGFGSRLIERALASDLGASAGINYAPCGIICTIEAPAARRRGQNNSSWWYG